MSQHPNVILKCTLKAQGTTRELLRRLLRQNREEVPDGQLPLWVNSATGESVRHGVTGEPLRKMRDDDDLAIGGEVTGP